MDGTNEFVRTQCYKHLLKYTNEASIEIKGKYTFFDSLDGKRLKIKNSDILTYYFERRNTKARIEQFFKPVRTGFYKLLLEA
jgi:hypothetical protein